MAEDKIAEEDDFEKLLNSFINTNLEDIDTEQTSEKSTEPPADEPVNSAAEDKAAEVEEDDLSSAFAEAREAIAEDENAPVLSGEESELAQAFINYKGSIDNLAKEAGKYTVDWQFSIDYLYPNYKPSFGVILSEDVIAGWKFLCAMFPDTVGKFDINSSDEQFLNFAEAIKDQNLQLAVISYVEIIIDAESCEISYQMKLAKYQEKHIKRIMYEEYLARKERQKRFVEAVQKKNFPIDAERLIGNYFKTAQKDVNGAYAALTTNPAIFAPIEFNKIKPRLFGLIKISPKDGIKFNIKLGKYLKKLKI